MTDDICVIHIIPFIHAMPFIHVNTCHVMSYVILNDIQSSSTVSTVDDDMYSRYVYRVPSVRRICHREAKYGIEMTKQDKSSRTDCLYKTRLRFKHEMSSMRLSKDNVYPMRPLT